MFAPFFCFFSTKLQNPDETCPSYAASASMAVRCADRRDRRRVSGGALQPVGVRIADRWHAFAAVDRRRAEGVGVRQVRIVRGNPGNYPAAGSLFAGVLLAKQ